jgi:hypothetical protein
VRETQRSKEFLRTLVVSLISIAATLLSVLISISTGISNSRYAVPALYVFLVSTLALCAGIYLSAYLQDLKVARRDFANAQLLERVVPTFIMFRRRVDTFSVERDGDAMLTWDFELSSSLGASLTELNFPIVAEYEDVIIREESPLVVAEYVETNGERQDASDAYRVMERHALLSDKGVPTRRLTEHALLRVPIALEDDSSVCRVRVTLRFCQLFRMPQDRKWLIIDVPYSTERLTVTINSPGQTVRRDLRQGGVTLAAAASLLNTTDVVETSKQNQLCRQIGSSIVWETESAKIGYRYRLFFQLESFAPSPRIAEA